MKSFHSVRTCRLRLRAVFDDDEVSVGVPPSVTLADVADWVDGVSRFHTGAPLAIDVTLPYSAAHSLA
jgi:hypothetical protein